MKLLSASLRAGSAVYFRGEGTKEVVTRRRREIAPGAAETVILINN